MLTRSIKMSQKSIMSFFKTKGNVAKSPNKLLLVSEIDKADIENAIDKNSNSLNFKIPEEPVTTDEIVLSPFGHKIPLRKTASRKLMVSKNNNINNCNIETETKNHLENSRIPLKEFGFLPNIKEEESSNCDNLIKNDKYMEIYISENMMPDVDNKNYLKDECILNDTACDTVGIDNKTNSAIIVNEHISASEKEESNINIIDFQKVEINVKNVVEEITKSNKVKSDSKVKKRSITNLSSSEDEKIYSNSKKRVKGGKIKRSLVILSSESELSSIEGDISGCGNDTFDGKLYKGNNSNLKKNEGISDVECDKSMKIKTNKIKIDSGTINKHDQKRCESGNESEFETVSQISSKSKKNKSKINTIDDKEMDKNISEAENLIVKKGIYGFFKQSHSNGEGLKNSSDRKCSKIETNITSTAIQNYDANKSSIDDLLFDPSKDHYDSISDACWKSGENVPYIALAKTFEKIEATSARIRSTEILSNTFRSIIELSPTDLLFSVYLCLNRVAPAYEAVELGIGDTLLMKVIAQATGRSMDKLKLDIQEKGDIGLIAEASRTTQKTMFKPKNLTIQFVFKKLKEIASMSGNSAMTKKVDLIKGMYVACRQSEARYLIRSLSGKLRIGLAEKSVLHALAWSFAAYNFPHLTGELLKKKVEDTALIIKTTYCNCPNYDLLIPALLNLPLSQVPLKCKLTPGIPLKPMLAHPTKQIGEVLDRFGDSEFVCEYKYDGERAQIHLLDNGLVEIYSRNQENNTKKYPDIVERIRKACIQFVDMQTGSLIEADVEKTGEVIYKNMRINEHFIEEDIAKIMDAKKVSAILDCEAVAWNLADKHILPFQVLSTRKRKDANVDEIKVQVCVFAFDLLYLNGVSLVELPLRKRRKLLKQNFREIDGEFFFAKDRVTNDSDQVTEFLEESIKGNCEGLMVKTLDVEATYEIAKRSRNWLKLKKDYLDGVGDTLDLVVIGAYHGTGKRTGRYGGFLLACYDEENEEYQSICKIGTGFSDSDLESQTIFFSQHVINSARPYYRYSASHAPDHWFDAVQVWEVKAADLSLSPSHYAAIGLVESDKGISLRFPRFLKVRDDKKPEDATSSKQVASMYKSQDQIINQRKNRENSNQEPDEEDFY